MKKIFYIVAVMLQITLLAGAYVVHYFTVGKMGMLRYVIYKNQSWEGRYPIDQLKVVSIIIVIVLTMIAITIVVKKRKSIIKLVWAMIGALPLLTAFYVVFTLGSSPETIRAYYFISPMLGAVALIQVLKVLAGTVVCKVEK